MWRCTFETEKFWLKSATGTSATHVPVSESMPRLSARLSIEPAVPSHSIGIRPKRSEAWPTTVAPTRVRAERREV